MLKAPARDGRPDLRPSTYCTKPNAANVATTKSPGIERPCVIRDERHGHDGEQGEPDAKMEPETVLLRIGHRPVDA